MDFALSWYKHNISWAKQLAYLIRAILVGHVFEESNKRTACAVLITAVDLNDYKMHEKRAIGIIKGIVLKKVKSIPKIQRMIEDGLQHERKDRRGYGKDDGKISLFTFSSYKYSEI